MAKTNDDIINKCPKDPIEGIEIKFLYSLQCI